MSLKYLVIYHDKCIDGIMSATVINKYLTERCQTDPEHINFLPMNYGDDIQNIFNMLSTRKIDTIYIVDFSFSIETLHKMYEYVNLIELYDHHASAFRLLIDEDYEVKYASAIKTHLQSSAPPHKFLNIGITLDNSECGASLLWKELYHETYDAAMPNLIQHVKDWDIWKKLLPNTDAINKYLKMQDKTVARFSTLLIDFECLLDRQRAITIGNSLIEYEEQIEDSIISSSIETITINGVTGLCVNAPYTFASNIGNKLAERSGTFGATWSQMSDGVVKWSLRSIGDSCDVSALAESMGGGGHKNAAGFEMVTPSYDSETLEPCEENRDWAEGLTDDEILDKFGDEEMKATIDYKMEQASNFVEGIVKFPVDPAAPDPKSPEYFNEVITELDTSDMSSKEEYND